MFVSICVKSVTAEAFEMMTGKVCNPDVGVAGVKKNLRERKRAISFVDKALKSSQIPLALAFFTCRLNPLTYIYIFNDFPDETIRE